MARATFTPAPKPSQKATKSTKALKVTTTPTHASQKPERLTKAQQREADDRFDAIEQGHELTETVPPELATIGATSDDAPTGERYATLPAPAQAALRKADELIGAKAPKEWTKEDKAVYRKGLQITNALRSMGYTVDRPASGRKGGRKGGTGGRHLDTDRASAENVALREAAEQAIAVPFKSRTKEDKDAIIAWRRRDYRIRKALNEPAPARSKKARARVQYRVRLPEAAPLAMCQDCEVKPTTMRVVDATTTTHADTCNGCGLHRVARLREDAGHVVALFSIKDGQVVIPVATPGSVLEAQQIAAERNGGAAA